MSIEDSCAYVLEQAKLNIEFARANPSAVSQAKQVNASLAAIVAMERNMVMHRALNRTLRNRFPDEDMQDLPEHNLGPEGGQAFPQPVPQMLGGGSAGSLESEAGSVPSNEPEKLRQTRRKTA